MKFLIILISFINISQAADSFEFTVFHTNDLHSYFEGSGPDMNFTEKVGDGDIVSGHYARLAYLIKNEKSLTGTPNLLLDAGDFFAGTLFHAIGPNKKINIFPEAEFFSLAGYDATTFGNHEFDAGDRGLETMLNKWIERKVKTPIISSNSFFQNKDSVIRKFFGKGLPLQQYVVKELSYKNKKLRVGLVGLLGPDGALVSLATRSDVGFIGFNDKKSKKDMDALTSYLNTFVTKIRKEENLDIVIGLIHGGHPEDREILEEVSGINLLIAGHTHVVYPTPIKVNKALLVQAGSFGRFLGKLKLSWNGSQLKLLNDDTILNVDDSLPVDKEMMSAIKTYKGHLNQYLAKSGFNYDSFIFKAKNSFTRKKESLNELGVLVTSGVRDELNKTEREPIDLYFTSLGLIRKNIVKGHSYQLSDIFKILAIGFDEDLDSGSKVVSFYLNKSEVFDLINFMEVYGMISGKFTPAFSNSVSYRNRWWGIPFVNKLADLKFKGKSYDQWPELINVATSQFVAAYLPKVQAMSYGMLEFIPKDINGKELKSPKILSQKEYVLLAKYFKNQSKH